MRHHIRLTIILTVLWMLLFGGIGPLYVISGLVVGFLSILLSQPVVGSRFDERNSRGGVFYPVRGVGDLARRLWAFARLMAFYNYELIKTNLMMARDVIVPRPKLASGIFAMEIPGLGPVEMTTLSNLIGLTPGTIVVDYDEENETLYIQTIYANDIESMKEHLRLFARLICQVTGCQPSGPRPESN